MHSRRFLLSAAVLGCFEGRAAPGRARAVPAASRKCSAFRCASRFRDFALPPEMLRRISFSYAGTLDGVAEAFAGRIDYACIPLGASTLADTGPVEVSVEAMDSPAHEVWRRINGQVSGRTLVIHPDVCTVEVCHKGDPRPSRLPRTTPLRALLAAATVLAGVAVSAPSHAGGTVQDVPFPPVPSQPQYDAAAQKLGNPLNQPVTGAAELPVIVGGERPPSLEALQATRPGDEPESGLEAGRAEILRQSGTEYGAQGGLSARAFAINEMLRRYEPQLDGSYDFRALVLPVGGTGQTLMRPPVVTEGQMAFALGDAGAQVARETSCIYQITRTAELASAPPNWRSYLVRSWGKPPRPADAALPRTKAEVAYWNKFVAEGWGQGEKQAVDIFLSDLGRLQRDLVGMARYRVLLRAHLVEPPRVSLLRRRTEGGRDTLRVGDTTVRITDQPGLQANPRRWTPTGACAR